MSAYKYCPYPVILLNTSNISTSWQMLPVLTILQSFFCFCFFNAIFSSFFFLIFVVLHNLFFSHCFYVFLFVLTIHLMFYSMFILASQYMKTFFVIPSPYFLLSSFWNFHMHLHKKKSFKSFKKINFTFVIKNKNSLF